MVTLQGQQAATWWNFSPLKSNKTSTTWRMLNGWVDDLEPTMPGVKLVSQEVEKQALLSIRAANFLKHGLGLSFAVGLNGLVQYWGDADNPYLSSQQKGWRVVSASAIGGGGGYVAATIAGTLFATKVGAALGIAEGPAGILVGAGVGFIYGVVYFGVIQPIIFENRGWNPKRNLAPIQP